MEALPTPWGTRCESMYLKERSYIYFDTMILSVLFKFSNIISGSYFFVNLLYNVEAF